MSRSTRIGLILKGYPRLSEVFVLNEILLLERLGHRLHIFAMRDPGETKVHDKVRSVQAPVTYIPDDLRRSFLAVARRNFGLFVRRPVAYLRVWMQATKAALEQRNTAPLKRFLQAGYLATLVPDDGSVVHWYAHFSHDPTTVALYVSRLTGIDYSFSAHAKDIYLQPADFLREKIAGARFVVTCTEYNRNYLERVGKDATPVFRCYHGVDFERIGQPVVGVVHPSPRILSVGRLVPKKGFPVLIEALRILRDRNLSCDCTIVGSGPQQAELQQAIDGVGLNDVVKLVGPMAQQELFRLYREADLFALACQVEQDGDRDGIPNVLVEAMAMGLPVVSTNISGIPECVEHGVSGLLVEARDPVALAEAIARVAQEPLLARRMGRAARERVQHEFDAMQNVGRISGALRDIIASKVA